MGNRGKHRAKSKTWREVSNRWADKRLWKIAVAAKERGIREWERGTRKRT